MCSVIGIEVFVKKKRKEIGSQRLHVATAETFSFSRERNVKRFNVSCILVN